MGDAPVPFSTRLFWDTTPEAIDWQAHGDYVISRVLQFGTVDELALCIRYYGWPRVERVALFKRGIPDDIRAFWAWYVSGSGEEPSQGHRAESARPHEELDEDVASLLEEIVPAGRMPQAYVALYRWCRQRNIDVPQLLEIARAVVPWLNSQLILQCLVILDDGAEMSALGSVSKEEWAEARRFFAAGVRRFVDQLCAPE